MLVVEAYKMQNEISILKILMHNLEATTNDLHSFYGAVQEGIQVLHRLACKVRGVTNKYGTILSTCHLIHIVAFLSCSPNSLRRVCKLWSHILHTKEACKILQIPSTKVSINFLKSWRLDDVSSKDNLKFFNRRPVHMKTDRGLPGSDFGQISFASDGSVYKAKELGSMSFELVDEKEYLSDMVVRRK